MTYARKLFMLVQLIKNIKRDRLFYLIPLLWVSCFHPPHWTLALLFHFYPATLLAPTITLLIANKQYWTETEGFTKKIYLQLLKCTNNYTLVISRMRNSSVLECLVWPSVGLASAEQSIIILRQNCNVNPSGIQVLAVRQDSIIKLKWNAWQNFLWCIKHFLHSPYSNWGYFFFS